MASDEPRAAGPGLADESWKVMQQKTFTKWCNLQLGKIGLNIADLGQDLHDGLKLGALLEVISGDKMKTKMMKNCKMRIQKMQNLSVCIQFIQEKGVRLENISGEDICDGNLKLILGLIWTLIEKFEINDISEDEMNAKDALLFWCQKQTKSYNPTVSVTNFHTSWKDGLAFCAIIHKFRPDLIPWDSLNKTSSGAADNLELAFRVAESLGIPRFLDVSDMVESIKPDERSVMTYVSQYYKYFSKGAQGETAGRRVGKLVKDTRDNDQMKDDYTRRAKELVAWIDGKLDQINGLQSDNTLEGAEAQAEFFNKFLNEEKPPKQVEKLDLEALFNAINLKLKNANRPSFAPGSPLTPEEINAKWEALIAAERQRQQAIKDELERQQRIKNLLARFNRKAAKLEQFNGEKSAYLNVEENIDTLNTAQTKVKLHEGHATDIENSKARLQEVRDLGAEIVALEYKEKDEVSNRVNNLNTAWEGLESKSGEKKKVLQAALEREEAKDKARREFARVVADADKWFKAAAVGCGNTDFGTDLDSVKAYQSTLDGSNNDLTNNANGQLEAVRKADADLKALGVTDNKYTVLTVEDIEKDNHNLDEAKTARQAAYQAEVERQEAMEAKRVEFAEVAQSFIGAKDALKGEIDALEGEPEPLAAAINEKYQGGAALQPTLDNVVRVDGEAKALGVTSNKHTNLSVPKVRSEKKQLDISVKNYLFQLDQEKTLKKTYETRAAELVAWINANMGMLNDLTVAEGDLAAAQEAVATFNAWKVNEKGEKSALKAEVVAIASDIEENLHSSSHKRPAFAPPAEYTLDTILAAWNGLEEAQKKKDGVLQAELNRQEKLTALVKRFTSDSSDLENWLNAKEAYLSQEEQIQSLSAAQVKMATFQTFQGEYKTNEGRRNGLVSAAGEIEALGYKDNETIKTRLNELTGRFDGLAGSASTKEAALQAALKDQQDKENARSAYAKTAAGYVRWNRDKCDTIGDYNFGFTLEAVTGYAEELDNDENAVRNSNTQQKQAVTDAAQRLTDLGVTENRHSTITLEDINKESEDLEKELTKRHEAYDAEVTRQLNMEEKRTEFATVGNAYAEWLAGQQSTIEGTQGSYDERIAAINELWQEGAPANAELEKVSASNTGCIEMGITENKHAQFTFAQLKQKTVVYNSTVKTLIASIKEQKEISEREAASQAARAADEAREAQSIAYSQHAQKVLQWLDVVDEATSEDLTEFETVEAVKAQRTAYDAAVAARADNEATWAELQKLNGEMVAAGNAAGVPSVEEVGGKWTTAVAALDARAAALDAADVQQANYEKLRDAFATAATSFNSWLQTQKGNVNATGAGELEDQKHAQAGFREQHTTAGQQALDQVRDTSAALDQAGINAKSKTDATYASLKLEWEQLLVVIDKKITLIEREIAKKKEGDVSPEQLEEFKQVFRHFDKKNGGFLNPLEFKGCLQSLGQEPTEDEFKVILHDLDKDGSGHIEFNEFVHFMVNRTQDKDTPDEIMASFSTLAGGADTITEAQIRTAGLPDDEVTYLLANMPKVGDAYDYKTWAKNAFSR